MRIYDLSRVIKKYIVCIYNIEHSGSSLQSDSDWSGKGKKMFCTTLHAIISYYIGLHEQTGLEFDWWDAFEEDINGIFNLGLQKQT